MSDIDKTQMAVDIFSRLAKQYQDKFMNVEVYGKGLDLFMQQLDNGATVLELACGPGNITRYMLDRRSDLNILSTDLSEEMLELARSNNPEARFQKMNIKDISTLHKQFDGIVCGFGLPYISREEVEQLINDAAKAIDRNGAIYLSTMEDDYGKSGIETTSSGNQLFVYYHQEDYLKEALLLNSCSILDIERRPSLSGGKPVTDLMIVAKRSV